MNRLFVIAVASEKGGVGKTTIATNLAVYLKALREDLPVTIASFDNHFSVDQMFALGPPSASNIAALFEEPQPTDLVRLGQYGVQYVASARRLQPPPHSPGWLRQRLGSLDLAGILILDTRPILDWFSEAALLAADLVIAPVKDRAALLNADALRQVMAAVGRSKRLWLLPSLVDTRARLNAEVRVHEFLSYAARERDYQVLDIFISKSPKVESLASGFSSSVRPVLTHARNTAVHSQLKQLAEFVLQRFDANPSDRDDCVMEPSLDDSGASVLRRRQVRECPVCCLGSDLRNGHFFFDLRSRRRGYVHPGCFAEICADMNPEIFDDRGGMIVLTVDGPGLVGPDCRLSVHLFDDSGGLLESASIVIEEALTLKDSVGFMIGQPVDSAYRELVFLNGRVETVELQQGRAEAGLFLKKRRKITRELRQAGLF